jgi:hypothetical protein
MLLLHFPDQLFITLVKLQYEMFFIAPYRMVLHARLCPAVTC